MSMAPSTMLSTPPVDDHINVAANIGTSLEDMNRSLRFAMAAILGAEAINDEKFTSWKTQQRVLGLEFDSVAETVSIPASKISKARNIIANAKVLPIPYGELTARHHLHSRCRPFLQRLRVRKSNLHRFQIISVTEDMQQDLLWWWLVLHDPQLNGVSLEYFNTLPPPNIVVEVDTSDFGLCALDISERFVLTYQFSPAETALISDFKSGSSNRYDINFRELLSCASAVNEWGKRWPSKSCWSSNPPTAAGRQHIRRGVAKQALIAKSEGSSDHTSSHLLRFSASHVSGVNNSSADTGSRLSANASFETLFASLTSGWTQASPKLDVQGLINIWQRIVVKRNP
ncbi:hypothetical protein PHMEG_00037350 [Phytophthora megakarya]|uniref:Reverse transcriptase n=1 Tax=Phytophthora megakarya TaxID=4795 RepID=A0A225UJA9_9STRA|nr:hypothetical protein PHMEG_00037350 [Phytophthora megakarya]